MTIAGDVVTRSTDAPRHRSPGRRRGGGTRSATSYGFVALYGVLSLAFGVLPALYAVYLAFTDGDGGFAGIANFRKVTRGGLFETD